MLALQTILLEHVKALAYSSAVTMALEKSFITLTTSGFKEIKLFSSSLIVERNKLECFSFASFFRLG
jgi:hypothetical protein